jgi:hypothetical protein
MTGILLAMVWVLSGLFVAFLMRTVDEIKGSNHEGTFWIKNRGGFISILLLIAGAPFSLLVGIVVMSDYCNRK